MTASNPTGKFLESPRLTDTEPSTSWSTDELGAAAAAELAALTADEQSVTARYWKLGRVLTIARGPLTHGQWGAFLKQWKIDKTRASKAMRIFRGFATPEETAEFTVVQACEQCSKTSRRKTRKKPRKNLAAEATSSPLAATRSWSQFAELMTGVVERQLEEPEFLTPEEAATALTSLGRLLVALRDCEERLRLRCRPA